MKYAIIADVHGNLHSLQAVVEDAKDKGVDTFIFVGDYYGDMPYINEIYELMKAENSYIIKGNKEEYLLDLHMSARSQWKHVQFASLYWSYDECSEENLFDMINLPDDLSIIDEPNKKNIYVTHSIRSVFNHTKLDELTSQNYYRDYNKNAFNREEYLSFVYGLLNNDDSLNRKLKDELPDIYIFGHTHVQWHCFVENKLFINPGSCGKPLDFNIEAPYTILDIDENGIEVSEIRVPYNINEAIRGLKSSELYEEAPDWSNLVIGELKSGKDYVSLFFNYLALISKECNEDSWPVSTFVWKEAMNRWEEPR